MYITSSKQSTYSMAFFGVLCDTNQMILIQEFLPNYTLLQQLHWKEPNLKF